MPSAVLIRHTKRLLDDGAIVEVKLWLLPPGRTVPGSAHPFKYSLFYGRAGRRLLSFDNEAGKGDHVHIGDEERPYAFTSPERLVTDFYMGVTQMREAGL